MDWPPMNATLEHNLLSSVTGTMDLSKNVSAHHKSHRSWFIEVFDGLDIQSRRWAPTITLIAGSHIIVWRVCNHAYVYILQFPFSNLFRPSYFYLIFTDCWV